MAGCRRRPGRRWNSRDDFGAAAAALRQGNSTGVAGGVQGRLSVRLAARFHDGNGVAGEDLVQAARVVLVLWRLPACSFSSWLALPGRCRRCLEPPRVTSSSSGWTGGEIRSSSRSTARLAASGCSRVTRWPASAMVTSSTSGIWTTMASAVSPRTSWSTSRLISS